MNEELKQLVDEFFNLIKTGAHNEAVALVQYFIQRMPDDQRQALIDRMTKTELLKFTAALALAWKEANELSAAQSKQLLEAFATILLKCLTLAFEKI